MSTADQHLHYYHKTNHTHYDTWDSSVQHHRHRQQTSQTRRWGLSLKDDWTPMNDYPDMSHKIYYQHTEAHDWTYMPDNRANAEVNSNYDTDTGYETRPLAKPGPRSDASGRRFPAPASKPNAGRSARRRSQRLQLPGSCTQPEAADGRSYTLGGFVEMNQLRSVQLRRYSRRARGASID